MKKLPLVMLALLAAPAASLACAPCPKQLTLEESIARADAVVVAQRTDQSQESKPEFIEITAEAALKGAAATGEPLKVRSYSQMCPVIVAEKQMPAVFLLTKQEGGSYGSVGNCGVTTLPYENGYVTIDNAAVGISAPGMEVLSLKAFVTRFLPEAMKE